MRKESKSHAPCRRRESFWRNKMKKKGKEITGKGPVKPLGAHDLRERKHDVKQGGVKEQAEGTRARKTTPNLLQVQQLPGVRSRRLIP